MSDSRAATRGKWLVAIILLLWALMGDAAYLADVTTDPAVLSRSDPSAASAYAAMPWWIWSAYALAVWSGTAAAISLLLRRRAAVWFYAVSLIGIVIQFGWTFIMTDLIAQKGPSAMLFPMFIFIMGLFALWWSRSCAAAGILR